MNRKIIVLLLITFIAVSINAQDIIVKRSGDEIEAKVEEIGTTEIKYKRFDNEAGPTYTILKSEVFMIKYANGSKDIFEESVPEKTSTPIKTANTSEKKEKQPIKLQYGERKRNYLMTSIDFGGVTGGYADGFFVDLRLGYTRNYLKYFAWDIFSFHVIPWFSDIDWSPIQLMGGVRGYSPTFAKDMSGFFAFNAGVATDICFNIGFCCEIETGVSLTKKLYTALVFNYTAYGGTRTHNIYAIRLGFHF